ncbi:hypothetical protein GCM10023149_28310 [Mucilaginibacter gynuensis]|uniref:Uncharacterized protein n=1 Tax=Mucilaginibacter gynuensis TaxID=1302236 RepID=A0ABP8GKN8_9SPHI
MKNNRVMKNMAFIALLLFAFGCKKDAKAPQSAEKNDRKPTAKTLNTTVDVYVTGLFSNNGVGRQYARYFINTGSPVTLPSSTADAQPTGIKIVGNDVYICGYESSFSAPWQPRYWKNGVIVNLPAIPNSTANVVNSIFISGTDVYVVGTATVTPPGGSAMSRAVIWKNGVSTIIGSSSYKTYATDVTVAGSDVYIAGSKQLPTGYNTGIYWKNGVEYALSSGNNVAVARIAVVGTDTYIAGVGPNTLYFWKNGVIVPLSGGPTNGGQSSPGLAVSGADVYVSCVGFNSTAPYSSIYIWKNTGSPVSTISSSATNGNVDSTPGNLAVSSAGDIYFSGRDQFLACYWKNGVKTNLTSGTYTYPYGIALKEY